MTRLGMIVLFFTSAVSCTTSSLQTQVSKKLINYKVGSEGGDRKTRIDIGFITPDRTRLHLAGLLRAQVMFLHSFH